MLLIAECGNGHLGNINIALKLLRTAKKCGADLIKFQAGTASGFAREKKQESFYRKFELGIKGYKKLIEEGEKLNIQVFFSIWNRKVIKNKQQKRFEEKLQNLWNLKYRKIPARQISFYLIEKYANENTFISIPYNLDISKEEAKLLEKTKSYILHVVPEYPSLDPMLNRILYLKKKVNNQIGYSDHSVGIDNCIKAVKKYGAVVIEKHFKLEWQKYGFRDFLHSATPRQFELLKNKIC